MGSPWGNVCYQTFSEVQKGRLNYEYFNLVSNWLFGCLGDYLVNHGRYVRGAIQSISVFTLGIKAAIYSRVSSRKCWLPVLL